MAVQGITDWKGKPINKQKHGGVRAAFFTYFMVVMTSMAYVPLAMNLVTYFNGSMHMDIASSSTTVTNFIGVTCAFSLLGAFLSDAYITRLQSILIFGPFEILGLGLLALQAHLPSLRPPPCDISGQWSNCKKVHGYKAILLYIAMYSYSLGEGCVRANLPSFGGDQFDDDDPVELKLKSSFFNWFTFGISVGSMVGLILTVWIETKKGWDYGFGLSALVVLLGLLVLASGFRFCRNHKPTGSPLTRMVQVFVAAFRNRKLAFPNHVDALQKEHAEEAMTGIEVLPHTKGFRFLDKASISDGTSGDRSFCTVTQVEETKIVLRMLPIFISSVIGYMPFFLLLTFAVQQGATMNNKIGKIHISTATLLAIPTVFQILFLIIYDRVFVPFARRIIGYTSGITHLQRIGAGFIVIAVASCVAAVIESRRKKIAEENGLVDSGVTVPMSILWLSVPFLIQGITDATSFVGLLEFFSSEVSSGMKSMGTAIFWCTLGLGSLMGTFLVEAVNKVTRHGDGSRRGWVEGNNLNRSHLDWFYWLLTAISVAAFLNYLYWARNYVYRQNPRAGAGAAL